jgi:hypothetical protein
MMPTYLGGVQALIDGGRVVFERPAPDSEVLRCLWMLLPVSTRSRLWPASFAFGNRLGFDALVVPQAKGVEYSGYLPEGQAGDYPEGRYELALQVAIESGDQAEVDALFARRSRRDVMKLGLILLAAVVVLTVVMGLLSPSPQPPPTTAPAAAAVKLDLPPPEEYPQLNAEERKLLTPALTALAEKVGAEEPLPATAEELLAAIDGKLGTPDPRRQPGELGKHGPAQRQLRVLLWKHGAPEYNDVRLNPKELVEKLEQRLSVNRGDTAPGGR